jgi:hypothetical protein
MFDALLAFVPPVAAPLVVASPVGPVIGAAIIGGIIGGLIRERFIDPPREKNPDWKGPNGRPVRPPTGAGTDLVISNNGYAELQITCRLYASSNLYGQNPVYQQKLDSCVLRPGGSVTIPKRRIQIWEQSDDPSEWTNGVANPAQHAWRGTFVVGTGDLADVIGPYTFFGGRADLFSGTYKGPSPSYVDHLFIVTTVRNIATGDENIYSDILEVMPAPSGFKPGKPPTRDPEADRQPRPPVPMLPPMIRPKPGSPEPAKPKENEPDPAQIPGEKVPKKPGPVKAPEQDPTIPGKKRGAPQVPGRVKQPGGGDEGTKQDPGTKEQEVSIGEPIGPIGGPGGKPKPPAVTTPKDGHVISGELVMPGGARPDISHIANELGRVEKKLEKLIKEFEGPDLDDLLAMLELIAAAIGALTDDMPGAKYVLTAACKEKGQEKPTVFTVNIPESGDPFTGLLRRLDALAMMIEKSQVLTAKSCGRNTSTPTNNVTVTAFEVIE